MANAGRSQNAIRAPFSPAGMCCLCHSPAWTTRFVDLHWGCKRIESKEYLAEHFEWGKKMCPSYVGSVDPAWRSEAPSPCHRPWQVVSRPITTARACPNGGERRIRRHRGQNRSLHKPADPGILARWIFLSCQAIALLCLPTSPGCWPPKLEQL